MVDAAGGGEGAASSATNPTASPSAAAGHNAMHALAAIMSGSASGLSAAQVQNLARNLSATSMPASLQEDLKRIAPQIEALNAQAMTPEVAAAFQQYRTKVAKLDPSAPGYTAKVAEIPKPDMGPLKMPELPPDVKQKLRDWMATAAKANQPQQQQPAAAPAPGGVGDGLSPAQQQSLAALMSISGMPQAQDVASSLQGVPVPPALMEDLKRITPQLDALKAQVAAAFQQYQAEVAKLDSSDPDHQRKLALIPKPSVPPLSNVPEDIKLKWRQWLVAVEQQRQAAAASAEHHGLTPQQHQAMLMQRMAMQARQQQLAAQQAQRLALKQRQKAQKAAAHKAAAPVQAARRQDGQHGGQPAPVPAAAAGRDDAPDAAAAAAARSKPGKRRREGPPAEVDVVCNGNPGTFLVERQMMVCYCKECVERAAHEGLRRIVVSPSEYERHSGTGHSKKWKYTIRTADNTQTIGAWLAEQHLDNAGKGSKFSRSPFAAKRRKEEQQAEELAASQQLALGGPAGAALPPPRRRARKPVPGGGAGGWAAPPSVAGHRSEEEEEEEEEEGEVEGSEGGEEASDVDMEAAEAGGGGDHDSLGASAALSPPAERLRGPAQPAKQRRVLRWIRRSTASPEREGEEEEEEEQGSGKEEEGWGQRRQRSLAQLQAGAVVKREGGEEEKGGAQADALPLLLPMQRAARAAEAAGSAVAARPLGAASAAAPRRGAAGGRRGLEEGVEPGGLRSPTGKPWLQADHAMHEEHDGTDMRLGPQYQAAVPAYQGPPAAVGPSKEAQEPIAALPGPPEAAALASAAGPEKAQAAVLPRDATADVWLRDVADQVRATVTGRQQRQRKQSRWLQETVDPNAVLGGKALVERQFDEDDAKDRFMQGRRASASQLGGGGGVRLSELEALMAAGAVPEVTRWGLERQPDGSGGLELRVSFGGLIFAGSLLPSGGAAAGQRQRAALAPAASLGAADSGAVLEAAAAAAAAAALDAQARRPSGLLPATSAISSDRRHDTPTAAAAVAAPSLAAPTAPPQQLPPQEGESRPAEAGGDRRAAAEARFQAMEARGAPAGTKCALCRGSETDDIPEESRGLGGRSQCGLGQMILVRVSAVAHAWLHDQCARWSPEVHDPEGNNRLEGMRDAVRRGRMLRCKYCGEKGATLGCFKRTCRASYHLACARKYNCLLQVEPYLVACPEHVDHLPPPYNKQRAPPPQGEPFRLPACGGGGGGRGRGRGRGRGGRAGGGGWAAASSDSEGGAEREGQQSGSDSEGAGAVEPEGRPPADAAPLLAEESQQPQQQQKQKHQQPSYVAGAGQERQQRQDLLAEAAAAGAAAAAAGDTEELLAQLSAFASKLDQHQQQRQQPAALWCPPAAHTPFPLPLPAGGAADGGTRERIVDAPQLRAELAAELAAGTSLLAVNLEGGHFRLRSFYNAAAVTPAVREDADAILVLGKDVPAATAGWPRTHSQPELSPPRRADAFAALLLRHQQWARLPADERPANLGLLELETLT